METRRSPFDYKFRRIISRGVFGGKVTRRLNSPFLVNGCPVKGEFNLN
jgi:hypothetical protein